MLRIKVSHSQFSGRFYAEGSPPVTAHPIEFALHAAAARPNAPLLWEVMHERKRGPPVAVNRRGDRVSACG